MYRLPWAESFLAGLHKASLLPIKSNLKRSYMHSWRRRFYPTYSRSRSWPLDQVHVSSTPILPRLSFNQRSSVEGLLVCVNFFINPWGVNPPNVLTCWVCFLIWATLFMRCSSSLPVVNTDKSGLGTLRRKVADLGRVDGFSLTLRRGADPIFRDHKGRE